MGVQLEFKPVVDRICQAVKAFSPEIRGKERKGISADKRWVAEQAVKALAVLPVEKACGSARIAP